VEPKKIQCPKCGFEQNEAEECARCGVIFAKLPQVPEGPPGTDLRAAGPGRANSSSKNPITLTVLLLILGYLLHSLWTGRELRHPPGVLVPSEPHQVMIKNPVPWKIENRTIFPIARFNLRARVLGKESYSYDPGADISPIDLALGWGPMSDQKVLDKLEISQGGRCFYILAPEGTPPLPMAVLLANSSNMHMLPANAEIKKGLNSLRGGEIVELGGYLVGIQEHGQWTWVSSLSRTDIGQGACEIFWVERLSLPAR